MHQKKAQSKPIELAGTAGAFLGIGELARRIGRHHSTLALAIVHGRISPDGYAENSGRRQPLFLEGKLPAIAKVMTTAATSEKKLSR